MTIVIAHPGRQHSHQTAVAAHKAGLLGGYWTGIPCVAAHARRLPGRLARPFVHYAEVPLPERLVEWNPFAAATTKVCHWLLGPRLAKPIELASYRRFDRWVARRLPVAGARVFVGYESSTFESFRAAKALGMTTVLDAASLHHATQDVLHGFPESPRTHARMTREKDHEIALADIVVTLSEIARDSYLAAGVPAGKIRMIALGADLDVFASRGPQYRREAPFRFLFVGSQILRKGVDLLIEAFRRVRATGAQAELVFVGGEGDASALVRRSLGEGITSLGRLPQDRVAEEYRSADCFVLPSRNDSFGMVVAEALASGLPVLVSEKVGAKSVVRQDMNGWVVPANDAAALAERMTWCVRNRDRLRAMSDAARASSAGLTWESYHHRMGALFAELAAR